LKSDQSITKLYCTIPNTVQTVIDEILIFCVEQVLHVLQYRSFEVIDKTMVINLVKWVMHGHQQTSFSRKEQKFPRGWGPGGRKKHTLYLIIPQKKLFLLIQKHKILSVQGGLGVGG
jgi:hypothetical protein